MPEQWEGEWASKSNMVLMDILYRTHQPEHPHMTVTHGTTADSEANAYCVIGTDHLNVSVEWNDYGPFLWVGWTDPGAAGTGSSIYWSNDPEEEGGAQSWDDLDLGVNIIRKWLDDHVGPHPYDRTLRELLELDPFVKKDAMTTEERRAAHAEEQQQA